MSEYIHRSRNVSILSCHFFRRSTARLFLMERLAGHFGKLCPEIERRYELKFLEIGVGRDTFMV